MRRASALSVAAVAAFALAGTAHAHAVAPAAPAAIVTVYPVDRPGGVMVTTGGWGYCQQVRGLAVRFRYELLCGRYWKDGYLGKGLRARRHVDWGERRYLAELAKAAREQHRRIGGRLVLIGVSYSGFGVATLASHEPALRPTRVIVIDSYFDLVARRKRASDSGLTGREIDAETGGSKAELRRRSVRVPGLAQLVKSGTELTVVWSVSEEERRVLNGATCARDANAETLQRLANFMHRPVSAWVTRSRHGHDLWDHGIKIVAGKPPGRRVVFTPGGTIPAWSVCPG